MDNYLRLLSFSLLLALSACTKEEQVTILQDKYAPNVQDAKPAGDEFTVTLNARALQTGERGEWKILEGAIVDQYVYLEDKNNPFSRFKGLPGEEYTLEWTHWDAAGKMTVLKTKVTIPQLNLEFKDVTPANFQTIRTFAVDPKYKGKWTVEPAYGYITSKYMNGYAEAPENKPTIELHGYANTMYAVSFTYTYAGRQIKTQQTITTGDYTEDEGLSELQMARGGSRVLQDQTGHIIELNLSASATAWMLGDVKRYPSLTAFKSLRRLYLGGSSLQKIPDVIGEHYTGLEELNMDPMGIDPVFPENFGNLSKLKTLVLIPARSSDPFRVVTMPASFGKLKALESFSVNYIGNIDFNGTLGQLTNLQHLQTVMTVIPENIGDLKNLKFLDVTGRDAVFPQRLAECTALSFARIAFVNSSTLMTLPSRIGDLKQLQTLEIDSNSPLDLPPSFSALSALSDLKIRGVRSVPEGFGNLSNLRDLTLHGSFTKLPDSFGRLSRLAYLSMGGKAESLPASFGDLSSLVYFNAEHSYLKTLPETFGRLKNLGEIALATSKIEYLPETFAELDGLFKVDLSNTQLKTFPKQIIPLKKVNTVFLNGCQVGDIPADISKMKTGVIFNLYGVPNLTYEHMTYIKSITKEILFYTSLGFF